MIYTYQELKNKYNTSYSIKKAIEKEEIYKIEKWLYSKKMLLYKSTYFRYKYYIKREYIKYKK